MISITRRQSEVLEAIVWHFTAHSRAPTIRELGKALGIHSTNGVNDHLRALEMKGFIRRDAMKARSIQLVECDGCCQLCGHILESRSVSRVG